MASNLPGLENILDNLDVGIIIFDNKGTYLFVNKTLLQYRANPSGLLKSHGI